MGIARAPPTARHLGDGAAASGGPSPTTTRRTGWSRARRGPVGGEPAVSTSAAPNSGAAARGTRASETRRRAAIAGVLVAVLVGAGVADDMVARLPRRPRRRPTPCRRCAWHPRASSPPPGSVRVAPEPRAAPRPPWCSPTPRRDPVAGTLTTVPATVRARSSSLVYPRHAAHRRCRSAGVAGVPGGHRGARRRWRQRQRGGVEPARLEHGAVRLVRLAPVVLRARRHRQGGGMTLSLFNPGATGAVADVSLVSPTGGFVSPRRTRASTCRAVRS